MLSLISDPVSLQFENQLDANTAAADVNLQQLSSGSRLNSGADDPAALSIASGLDSNVAALNQSAQNITDGMGLLQTADGALSQITTLLNRGITLATEAANGTVSDDQRGAIDGEFQALLAEVNNIAAGTEYNGTAVFQLSLGVADRTIDDGSIWDKGDTIYGIRTPTAPPVTLYTGDGTASGASTFTYQPLSVDARALGLTVAYGQTRTGQPFSFGTNVTLLTASSAAATLTTLTGAVAQVSGDRGTVGSLMEELQAAASVDTAESQNLSSASSTLTSADLGATIARETRYSILQQTGIAALQQEQSERQQLVKIVEH